MSEKRRGLGRGLGALIPSAPPAGSKPAGERPVDVFFPGATPTARKGEDTEPAEPEAKAEPAGEVAPVAPSGPAEPAAPAAPAESAGTATAGADGSGEGFTGNHDAGSEAAPERAAASGAAAETDDTGLVPVPGARFAEVPVGQIAPNPKQPRQVFDEEALAELVHSVREIGVLQPVVVRELPADETGPRYELVMGERRWRASREAGLETVPAIIRETTDDDLLRDALLENLHRSQLNPLEEAAAYQQLLDDFGCTHDELAGRIGRSRPQISNTLRLMKLPPLVQRRVAAGVLSAGHARALLGLPDGAAMERLAQRIVAEGLSVRATEEIVALGVEDEAPAARRRPRAGDRHEALDALAGRLSDRLDTRVKIALGQRKGRLTVEFATVDDLNRIIGVLAPDESGVFRGN